MARGVSETWDALKDLQPRAFSFGAMKRTVFVAGAGPAVIIIHELPGITPEVLRFARWVREAGFTIYLPSLFGRPGKPNSQTYIWGSLARICIAREFRIWAADEHSPIVDWLKQLARQAHSECGGRGVGALGMCVTGNFALSMMVEPAVCASVLCQPALPLNNPIGVHASPEDLAFVRQRLEQEDLVMAAYRFAGDPACRAERFEAMGRALGPRFQGEALPDRAAKPGTFRKRPHAVVTTHLIDEAGSLTRRKVEEIIDFFRSRLAT